MTETLERPQNTSESEGDFRLDLGKIDVSDHLSETSSFELRAAAPTTERPAAIYVAAPKKGNKDLMTESLFAVQENREAFWQVSDSPESVGVVRARADGNLQELGVGDEASITGRFTIERGEKIYLIPNQLIEALKKDGRFNDEDINLALSSKEGIKISFDSAVTVVSPDVSVKSTSDKKAGFARRMRNRSEQAQGSTDKKLSMGDEASASAQPSATSVHLEGTKDTTETNHEVMANSAAAHQLRADRAAELVREMNRAATMPLQTTPTSVDTRAVEPNVNSGKHAAATNPLRGFAQRKQAQQKQPVAPSVKSPVRPRPLGVTINAESDETMTDEERQYLEDERRGFKITDNRKWSRIEMLGHEVGIHSDVSITMPVPETKSNASSTEIGIQAFLAKEMAKEKTPVTPKDSAVPFEVVNYNPNNDPAIEYGIARLGALRDEMASLTATKQNQLFSVNGKKTREIANAYTAQLVALGHLVTADKMFEHMLTDSQKGLAIDSQKSIAVTKYIINEQAALQAATKEKLKGTKAGKFAEWMNTHGIDNDYSLDARMVMQVIDHDLPGDDQMRLAYQHMADLHKKYVRAEQHERRKGALRVAAIGVVGTAAAALGVNPSMAGDAANNILYGARKK